MNPYESTYFGTTGMTHALIKTTAVKSIEMILTPQGNDVTVPMGFAQTVLAIQDTQFMMSGAAGYWDRFRVRRIKFRYSPMGTESIYLNMFMANGNRAFLYPPYSNGPLLITYDPTANVENAAQTLNTMTRFYTAANQLDAQKYVLEGRQALRQSQHYVGETTKTFKGNIVSPRAMLYNSRGPQGYMINSDIDLGSQYKLGQTAMQENQFVTTYGMLNFILPRSTTELTQVNPNPNQPEQATVLPTIRVNVSITYYLDVYGQT